MEVTSIYPKFMLPENEERFLHVVYWLGKLALDETVNNNKRIVTFSPVLRERLGHHIHGEVWADAVKQYLLENNLMHRPVHIISANMHSVMNTLFTPEALKTELKDKTSMEMYEELSDKANGQIRNKILKVALANGMKFLEDSSGTNIDVQVFDTAKLKKTYGTTKFNKLPDDEKPVLVVMDYAFGEQAYETMDELLKPFTFKEDIIHLNVVSVSIMGKAGILDGGKGDIMIPDAHLFEGTADNYPFSNELRKEHLEGNDIKVVDGTMITVLGTSLQNKDILKFFQESTWNVVGLEMEGAHYQKAIQAASKLRGNIRDDVKVRYAYYASDNPLETGSTLASGGLGTAGVKPTYLITEKILEQIFNS